MDIEFVEDHHILVFQVIQRPLPAQFPDGLLADKRNALVNNDILHLFADERTIDTLDG